MAYCGWICVLCGVVFIKQNYPCAAASITCKTRLPYSGGSNLK